MQIPAGGRELTPSPRATMRKPPHVTVRRRNVQVAGRDGEADVAQQRTAVAAQVQISAQRAVHGGIGGHPLSQWRQWQSVDPGRHMQRLSDTVSLAAQA